MAKDKLVKNITINELADMVQKGFAGQDKRFDNVERNLAIIKSQLVGIVYKPDFDKLEMRVEYLENMLNLSAKKH